MQHQRLELVVAVLMVVAVEQQQRVLLRVLYVREHQHLAALAEVVHSSSFSFFSTWENKNGLMTRHAKCINDFLITNSKWAYTLQRPFPLIITLVKKENNEKTCSIHKTHLCTIFGSSTISFADRVAIYSI